MSSSSIIRSSGSESEFVKNGQSSSSSNGKNSRKKNDQREDAVNEALRGVGGVPQPEAKSDRVQDAANASTEKRQENEDWQKQGGARGPATR